MKLNHLALTVKDCVASRDWYITNLGLRLDFESADQKFVALEDHADFGFLLAQGEPRAEPGRDVSIYFEVEDVDELFSRLDARGLRFDHPPQKTAWGYGPQLRDPDGYVLRFFDHRSVTK